VVGIRPEDIQATEPDAPHDLEATIELSERLGAEINLLVDYQGTKLTVRVPSAFGNREGQVVALKLDTDKIHLFDKETEISIAH
jgi:multiple sugar transport system ATP-binding protein